MTLLPPFIAILLKITIILVSIYMWWRHHHTAYLHAAAIIGLSLLLNHGLYPWISQSPTIQQTQFATIVYATNVANFALLSAFSVIGYQIVASHRLFVCAKRQ